MAGFTRQIIRATGKAARSLGAVLLALALTLTFFLVLPLMQQVTKPPDADLELRQVSMANIPPPPPPPPEEKPEEDPDEPPPPEMAEPEAAPLDLSQLELALNPGLGEGGGAGALMWLGNVQKRAEAESEAIFSMADLDQKPRVVSQSAPEYPPELKRQKVNGTVHILFIVDKDGRVVDPRVQKSTLPQFERPALMAVKRWRFEPGKRSGKPVQFKMRVPITFRSS